MRRVSLKDIARMTGVSPSTVSFVLNGKATEMRISKEVSKKILTVAKKSGYQPNQVAISLRTGKSKIIGLIVESISGNFFASFSKVIEEEAERFGYKVVYCSTENDDAKGRELIRMLSNRQVDGYLITPTAGMEKDIRELIADKSPVVLMDSYFPSLNVPYVLVDNFAGVAEGMSHLVRKGLRKIGFITVDLPLVQIQERKKAYIHILKENNIRFEKKYVLTLKYNCSREGAIKEISKFIQGTPELQALFFATNYLGLSGLESIRQLDLQIPGDISIVCFDDHDLFRLYAPGITVIQQPIEDIAMTAIHLLMQQMGNKTKNLRKNHFHLAAKFILRKST